MWHRPVVMAAIAGVGVADLVGCGASNSARQAGGEAAPEAVTCATGAGKANSCKVGDQGPGGGTVFYVNEANPDGSRYMEAAPETLDNGGHGIAWCSHSFKNRVFGVAIGTGKANTDAMMMIAACKSGAALVSREYATTGAPAGSWSLPSKDELNALDASGVSGWSQHGPPVWSSSGVERFGVAVDQAWVQFTSGGEDAVQNQKVQPTFFNYQVRPVKAF